MKKFAIAAVVLGLVVFAGLFWFVSNLDDIVAKVIETEGSKVTGTQVRVSGVAISLKEGRGTIDGLTIASPAGFDPDLAFALDGVTLDLDLESLRSDVIVIDEIRVTDPQVTAQVLKDGSSNLTALQKNAEQYGSSHGGGGAGDKGDAQPSDKRIRIKRFAFDGGRVALDATALGDKQTRSVDLPAFTINDIGGARGATPDQVAKAALVAVTKQAAQAVAKAGVEQKAREVIEEKAGEAAKGLLDKIGG